MSHAATDSPAVLSPDQAVLHAGRRATFLHMSRGEAIIRYWGGSHAVAVPPQDLQPWKSAARPRPPAEHDQPLTRDVTRT